MTFTAAYTQLMQSLVADTEIENHFSDKAELDCMIAFEIALAKAQFTLGMIDKSAFEEIAEVLPKAKIDMQSLQGDIARDGMPVPGFLKQLRSNLSEISAPSLHLHSTSQDVIDTSAMVRMKSAITILRSRLDSITEILASLKQVHGSNKMMAYTRMQAALPTTVSERLDSWERPLVRLSNQPLLFPIQLGGPVASNSSYDGMRDELEVIMSQELSLESTGSCWHAERGYVVEIGNWLSAVTGQLAKFGQDIALMAQMGREQIELSSGGASSAMKHKKNPVLAEKLISLGRYNATQISGLHNALIHEQERSGSAWMLEWMIIPQMFIATGAATLSVIKLLSSIETIGKQ